MNVAFIAVLIKSWIDHVCSAGHLYNNLNTLKHRGFPTLETLSKHDISQPDFIESILYPETSYNACSSEIVTHPLPQEIAPPPPEFTYETSTQETREKHPASTNILSSAKSTEITPRQNPTDVLSKAISVTLTTSSEPGLSTVLSTPRKAKKHAYIKRNRNSKLNKNQFNQLLRIYQRKQPKDFDIVADRWTGKSLRNLCKTYFNTNYKRTSSTDLLKTLEYFSEIESMTDLKSDQKLNYDQEKELIKILEEELPAPKASESGKWDSKNVSILITNRFHIIHPPQQTRRLLTRLKITLNTQRIWNRKLRQETAPDTSPKPCNNDGQQPSVAPLIIIPTFTPTRLLTIPAYIPVLKII